jgi:hypothetical protein
MDSLAVIVDLTDHDVVNKKGGVRQSVEASSLQGNDSNHSCESSEPKKGRRNRRRGRCNHPVSSLVQQCGVNRTEINGRRGATVSSLMNLSTSAQKTQMNRRSNKSNDRRPLEDDLVRNIQSMKIDDAKANSAKSPMQIKQPKPSWPTFHSPVVYKQRPFALPGECTSPPSFLHRLSSVSNSMFQKSTPGKNNNAFTPGSSAKPRRKRLDKKKTPDKLTAMEECGLSVDLDSMEAVSPLVTEFSVNRRRRKSLNNPVARVAEEAVESNECSVSFECCQEEMSHTGVSPRNLLASPLQSASRSAPKFEVESPCAKANLFPAAESNPLVGCVIPKRTGLEKVRGSSVLAVEVATPRVFKSASSEESSGVESTKKERIRGSAVLSIQKAPAVSNQCAETKAKLTKQKSGCRQPGPISRHSKPSMSEKVTQMKSRETIPVEEGMRRSARESKPTDRLTVTWNDTVAGTSNARSNKSSSDELVGNIQVDILPKVAKKGNSKLDTDYPITMPIEPTKEINTKQTLNFPLPDGQWSNEEVSMLRHVQMKLDPTVSEYWEEVACLIGGKSASECRDKWFSLVATPRGRPQKENKKQPNAASTISADDSFDEEDDLFHSTPLRESLRDMAKKLSNTSTFGTSFGLSPCIQSATTNVSAPPGTTSDLKERRKGYKTYIDNLRKDLNPLHKNAKKFIAHRYTGKSQVYLESGDYGKLLHDGTVQFTMHEENEDEDDFFDEEDEE